MEEAHKLRRSKVATKVMMTHEASTAKESDLKAWSSRSIKGEASSNKKEEEEDKIDRFE
jgi:hypothetical protein